jgi:hypothetical protein
VVALSLADSGHGFFFFIFLLFAIFCIFFISFSPLLYSFLRIFHLYHHWIISYIYLNVILMYEIVHLFERWNLIEWIHKNYFRNFEYKGSLLIISQSLSWYITHNSQIYIYIYIYITHPYLITDLNYDIIGMMRLVSPWIILLKLLSPHLTYTWSTHPREYNWGATWMKM